MSIEKIKFYLSGGVPNADPLLSLGGNKSNTEVFSQSGSNLTGTITGVTIAGASGNVNDAGALHFDTNPMRLYWQMPNGIPVVDFADWTVIYSDGRYIVPCREGGAALIVDVVSASLPVSAQQDSVLISSLMNNLFGDISETNALNGLTQYRCLYLDNVSGGDLNLEWWIERDMTAADGMEIGFSTFTSGSNEETVVDELTAPLAVTFYKNFSALTQQLTLNTGQDLGFWLKLTTPPLSEGDVPVDFGSIIFSEV